MSEELPFVPPPANADQESKQANQVAMLLMGCGILAVVLVCIVPICLVMLGLVL